MHGKRTRRATIGASIALLVASFGWAQPMVAAGASDPVPLVAPPVVVTIGFDDGTVDQFDALEALNAPPHARHVLHQQRLIIGDPDHMSVEQLGALAAAGNEIGGHTVDHANIQPLSTAEATAEVCDDRATLMGSDWGFTVTSFAYPFGSYDANSETIVKSCGYDSARTVSGVSIHVGKNKIGETLPPVDPYATRTPPNPKKATKLSTMKQYVLNAEAAAATGESLWIQFVFHRYCDAHCGAYTVQPAKFTALLDFLAAERLDGRVSVLTTAEAMAG